MKRPQVAEQLEIIYQTRNRLAHHEPVLHKRFKDTITAIEFISENMGVATPTKDTALAKLIADDFAQVIDKAKLLHVRLDSFRKL